MPYTADLRAGYIHKIQFNMSWVYDMYEDLGWELEVPVENNGLFEMLVEEEVHKWVITNAFDLDNKGYTKAEHESFWSFLDERVREILAKETIKGSLKEELEVESETDTWTDTDSE